MSTLTIIDRVGARIRQVCREHRIAHESKVCPKCAEAKASARRRRIRFENRIRRAILEQEIQRAI